MLPGCRSLWLLASKKFLYLFLSISISIGYFSLFAIRLRYCRSFSVSILKLLSDLRIAGYLQGMGFLLEGLSSNQE